MSSSVAAPTSEAGLAYVGPALRLRVQWGKPAPASGGTAIKLSAKFARQESEEARQARIGRRRIRDERVEAVQRMLGLSKPRRRRARAGARRTKPSTAKRDPRQRLTAIVVNGLGPDLYDAEQSLAILKSLDTALGGPAAASYGEFFTVLQRLLGHQLQLAVRRLFERARRRQPLPSIPAAIEILYHHAPSLEIERKDLLIQSLVRLGHAESDLRGLPAEDLTRLTANDFAGRLPDTRTDEQAADAVAFARQFVETVTSGYLGAPPSESQAATAAAESLTRMLRALQAGAL